MTNEKALDYWLNHEHVDDKEQREAVQDAISALRRTAEDDKAREEGRKTAYDENGTPYLIEAEGSEAKHIIELLAAEAQGRLEVLPCKAGDTLFIADRYNGKIYERTVERFTVGKSGYMEIWVGTTISANAKQVGKTVFFTRQAAEAALDGGGEGG